MMITDINKDKQKGWGYWGVFWRPYDEDMEEFYEDPTHQEDDLWQALLNFGTREEKQKSVKLRLFFLDWARWRPFFYPYLCFFSNLYRFLSLPLLQHSTPLSPSLSHSISLSLSVLGCFPEDFSQEDSFPESQFPRRQFPRRSVSQKEFSYFKLCIVSNIVSIYLSIYIYISIYLSI